MMPAAHPASIPCSVLSEGGTGGEPTVDGILHPTVKPLELMRWLVQSGHAAGRARVGAVRRQRQLHIGGMPTRTHAMHGKRTRSRLHKAGPRKAQQTNTKRTFLEEVNYLIRKGEVVDVYRENAVQKQALP